MILVQLKSTKLACMYDHCGEKCVCVCVCVCTTLCGYICWGMLLCTFSNRVTICIGLVLTTLPESHSSYSQLHSHCIAIRVYLRYAMRFHEHIIQFLIPGVSWAGTADGAPWQLLVSQRLVLMLEAPYKGGPVCLQTCWLH